MNSMARDALGADGCRTEGQERLREGSQGPVSGVRVGWGHGY